MPRNIPTECLLESEASLRLVDGMIEEFRRDSSAEPAASVSPTITEMRDGLTAVIQSIRHCNSELGNSTDPSAIARVCNLLAATEHRVRSIVAILNSATDPAL